jgi:hypothetical protein
VDDDAVNRVVLNKVLSKAGFECDCVHDGSEVLEKIKVCVRIFVISIQCFIHTACVCIYVAGHVHDLCDEIGCENASVLSACPYPCLYARSQESSHSIRPREYACIRKGQG